LAIDSENQERGVNPETVENAENGALPQEPASESKPVESKAEAKPAESKAVEGKAAEPKPAEEKSAKAEPRTAATEVRAGGESRAGDGKSREHVVAGGPKKRPGGNVAIAQENGSKLDLVALKDMSIQKLNQIAKDLGVAGAAGMRKQEL